MRGVLLLAAACAVFVVLAFTAFPDDRPVCHEDMACWNCETMGNERCGEG